MNLEIEFKFFIDHPSPSFLADLKNCPQNNILSQYLFSLQKSQELLIPKAQELSSDPQLITVGAELKGRVRSITNNLSKHYLLGLKGPKDEKFKKLDIVSKPELEVEITEADFNLLKTQADRGYIVKNRTDVPCSVKYQDQTYQFVVEFDHLLEVNGTSLKSRFLIAEIEIPELNSSHLIQVIRSGEITLHFISKNYNFKNLNPVEVAVNCAEDYSDLMASRKLVNNIGPQGPSEHLKKYFDE